MAPQTTQQRPDLTTGDSAFDGYAIAMADGDTPLLGHLVLYSIFDSEVAPADLKQWFTELGLDQRFLPAPLRNVDAYEKVTGPDGVRVSYPLDDPSAGSTLAKRRGRKRLDGRGRSASLMIRPVRRDGGQIVRHVVREIRDEQNTRLAYDPRLGVCIFHRDNGAGSPEGAGTLQVEPDHTAIAKLPEAERAAVKTMLGEIADSYSRRCTYLHADKLRSVIRTYVEYLNAIRIRSTGGVYFVHQQHAGTLGALRDLVARFGEGSHLARIPLPDQDEMRQLVVSAFTTKAKDDLDKLAGDIAAAQRDGDTGSAQKLYRRFTELQAATAEHADLLSTTLDDTNAALQLVKTQLGNLLVTADETDTETGAP